MGGLITKEKIVFVLALVLLVWGLRGALSPANPAGSVPPGRPLEKTPPPFLSPDLRLAETDELYRERGRDLFAEPIALKPLSPLELAPPPLVQAPLTAPPPVPGPPPRHWAGLRHHMPPATAAGGGAQAGRAGAPAAGSEPGTATPGADEAKKAEAKVDPAKTYDSVIRRASTTRLYGRIRNPDPLALVEAEKDDEENQFVLKRGARLEFDYFDPATGLRRGAETFGAGDLEVFSLAATPTNLYAIKRRRLPPGSVNSRIALARWLTSIGRVDWAAGEYREAMKLDPRRKDLYLELGQTLEREYLWEDALQCYRSAREQGVDDPALLYREGLLLKRFGLIPAAFGRFRQALEVDRGDTRSRIALGECLVRLGRVDEAVVELKQAYGASAPAGTPIASTLWFDAAVALGRAYLAAGDFKEAARYFRAVVDADRAREHKEAFHGLAATLYAMGGSEALGEALPLWAAGDRSPLTRVALIHRGYALVRLGRFGEAREALEQALREDPLHADLALLGLAFVAECEGKHDEALETYEEALVRNPTLLYAHLAIGRIQRQQGDPEAARAALARLLDQAPDAVDALLEMALACLAVNQTPEALRYLERARQLEPSSLALTSAYGACLLRAQREEAAMAVFQSVLARRDDDPLALASAAVVHYRRGDVPKAIGNFQSTMEAGRNDPRFRNIVEYARRTAAAIEDNARKRLWEDDFNRTEIRNDWSTEHSHGVVIRSAKGAVEFHGTQQVGDAETALLRTVSLGQLVSFDVALTVPEGTRAAIGVEIVVRRSSQDRTAVRGAIQFVRDPRGQLAYRIHEGEGEFAPWQLVGRAWPAGAGVRLGFQRSGEREQAWSLTLDGRVIQRDIEVKPLRGWNRDAQIGVFGAAKIGTEWACTVDDVRMILRVDS
ncbi:MAG: tetratricopeptide repeat protein [Planctomycetes bacterium]|nr:tetratricopeptide repeat protein [Planctomycetota bacterium]